MKKLHPTDAPNSAIKGQHKNRLKQSILFVSNSKYDLGNVLSIGDDSIFDKSVYKELATSWCTITHTKGDLDTTKWKPSEALTEAYDTVLCFEVLEHILNPRLFLETLKGLLGDKSIVFVSIPNHLLRRHWRTLHYHEIDRVRFEYLCEVSGYEIVDYKKYRYFPRLRDISGVRPFLRYITGYSWFISRTDRHFYAIKKK